STDPGSADVPPRPLLQRSAVGRPRSQDVPRRHLRVSLSLASRYMRLRRAMEHPLSSPPKTGRGSRDLKVRVRSQGRSPASREWLERQLNDPYVARAKREGLRSRAAFKLMEMDDKFRLLKPGAKVVDLGAAPGGWSQIAAQRTGAGGRVVAIDLLDM